MPTTIAVTRSLSLAAAAMLLTAGPAMAQPIAGVSAEQLNRPN